jgi:Potential Queuosine, Q, salvage protein family
VQVSSKQLIAAGSEEEVEIRAASVAAVELLRAELERETGQLIPSILLDWCLWQEGEANVAQHLPHHRTQTIYY